MAKKPRTIKEPAVEETKPDDTGLTDEQSPWSRLLPMIVLLLCFGLAEAMIYLIVLIQFIWVAVNGNKNDHLSNFGKSLSKWVADNTLYLSYNTEERPFPWKAWPKG